MYSDKLTEEDYLFKRKMLKFLNVFLTLYCLVILIDRCLNHFKEIVRYEILAYITFMFHNLFQLYLISKLKNR